MKMEHCLIVEYCLPFQKMLSSIYILDRELVIHMMKCTNSFYSHLIISLMPASTMFHVIRVVGDFFLMN